MVGGRLVWLVSAEVNCLFLYEERGFRTSFTALIMYTVIPRMKRLPFLAAALACLAAAAFAQTPSNRDIYMYQGADRDKRLVEGARKERQVLFYSTMTVADGKALAVAFEQKYGVRVNHWRGSAEKIRSEE